MSDIQRIDYEVYKARLDNGQEVLVQIFREPETGKVLKAQLAFRTFSQDTWSAPYPLVKS